MGIPRSRVKENPAYAWTLNQACELIREIDPKLREIGWVSALTGGVLFNGASAKDLDIIIYRFDQSPAGTQGELYALLTNLGFLPTYNEDGSRRSTKGASKPVETWQHVASGRRVDFFFWETRGEWFREQQAEGYS